MKFIVYSYRIFGIIKQTYMNKAMCIFLFLGISITVQAQPYIGNVTRTVNFRAEPTLKSEKIGSLKSGDKLVLTSKDIVNEYYHVIHVETKVEGYVYATYVKLAESQPENKEGVFKKFGKILSEQSVVRISNKSEYPVTLVLADKWYTFKPKEKTSLNLSEGTYSFIVLTSGDIDGYGTQVIEDGYEYYWNFNQN